MAKETGEAGKHLFVRYSHGPKADSAGDWTSMNHGSGQNEGGLSVNNLTDYKYGLHAHGDPNYVAQQLREYDFLRQDDERNKPYLVHGDIAGQGGDNEPVIRNVKPLAFVHPDAIEEARQRDKQNQMKQELRTHVRKAESTHYAAQKNHAYSLRNYGADHPITIGDHKDLEAAKTHLENLKSKLEGPSA